MSSYLASLSLYFKDKRKSVRLTQQRLAFKAEVGINIIHKMEQGKETL